jgi:hypothetical protein
VELIEGDVDMAFSLPDDAHAEYHESNAEFAHAALEDANRVVMDIEDRLSKLDAPHSARFRALARSFGRRFAARKSRALSSSLDPASRRLVVSFFLTLSPIREAHVRRRRT